MSIDPNQVVETIRHLSLIAGAEIMKIYQSPDFEVMSKSDDSPVTAADLAADKVISDGLRAAFPDVAIVTEEQAETHTQAGKTFFIVDPLDGTKEFVHRRGDFTVNIAYVENGSPKFGVVYAPAKERLFYVDATGQSVEEALPHNTDAPSETAPIKVTKPHENGLTVVASKSHADEATANYIAKYDIADKQSAGSSLKFCLVATGEADLYPRLGRTMEWDTAAGQAVLLGAGGQVVRFDDHRELTYGKNIFENPFFIAYAPWVELKPAD